MTGVPAAQVRAAEALVQPPICSATDEARPISPSEFCRIDPEAAQPGRHDVTLSLTAGTGPVLVGGYRVETDNYNGGYLPPVVEAEPGDTLRIRLLNALGPGTAPAGGHGAAGHGDGTTAPTNLHTHGLIVSANNATPDAKGDGDNVFARLDRGEWLDYAIELPTSLPASVLDGAAGDTISHPTGLYWYHSHHHGISATQVAGGMSGLLSVGARDVNVVAVEPERTRELRDRTDPSYMMLRDLQLTSDVAVADADGSSPAAWRRGFDPAFCGPTPAPAEAARDGYCLDPADRTKAWLFTVNGQRFPTVTVKGGRNHLWRIANLSASVTYRLDIVPDGAGGGAPLPFDILSVDGVVPTGTVTAPGAGPAAPPPVKAVRQTSLLLMPAGRADIYVRNDGAEAMPERRYVLRTTGCNTGSASCDMAAPVGSGDKWPEIRLADVVLEPTGGTADRVDAGLNAPVVDAGAAVAAARAGDAASDEPGLPAGCVPDIDPDKREHRRITFVEISAASGGTPQRLGLTSVNVAPPAPTGTHPITAFQKVPGTELLRLDFERYLDEHGNVVWDPAAHTGGGPAKPRHVCVQIGKSGHGQLWELFNPMGELHNFHLHQVKFRLATDQELNAAGIETSLPSPVAPDLAGGGENVWHDTLPVANGARVFIIVNFDAEQQIGRYVFHCHILEHEDAGMMAPIEVLR